MTTTQPTIIRELRDLETGKPLPPSRYAKDMQVIAVGTGPAPKQFGRIEAARWVGDIPEPNDAQWQHLGELLEANDKDAWRAEVARLGGELVSMVVGRWIPLDDEGLDEGHDEGQWE